MRASRVLAGYRTPPKRLNRTGTKQLFGGIPADKRRRLHGPPASAAPHAGSIHRHEVDETALHVGRNELDADFVADLESHRTVHQLALCGRGE